MAAGVPNYWSMRRWRVDHVSDSGMQSRHDPDRAAEMG